MVNIWSQEKAEKASDNSHLCQWGSSGAVPSPLPAPTMMTQDRTAGQPLAEAILPPPDPNPSSVVGPPLVQGVELNQQLNTGSIPQSLPNPADSNGYCNQTNGERVCGTEENSQGQLAPVNGSKSACHYLGKNPPNVPGHGLFASTPMNPLVPPPSMPPSSSLYYHHNSQEVLFDPTRPPPPIYSPASSASGQNSTPSPPTPTSPRNLNPTAPAFRQSQAAPASPKNLNPSAPVFRQSQTGERSPTEGPYTGEGPQGLLTNGDIHANSTNYMVPLGGGAAGVHRGATPQQQQGPHQMSSQGAQSSAAMGLNMASHSLLTTSPSNHQPVVAAVAPQQQQQSVSFGHAVQDVIGGQRQQQQARISGQGPLPLGNGSGEPTEQSPSQPNGGGTREDGGTDNVEPDAEGAVPAPSTEYQYPEDVLAPIRKQMQFYFSSENLPNDKFLNQNMDNDKFIPLDLFLDFGRIKPICNNLDQLAQAVESSSILELSEDQKKVRVSQCRKTLTLRGFPAEATADNVGKFVKDLCKEIPTHIEFVMLKERLSVWYVSFKDETAALNSFFSLHSHKAFFGDYEIGCCIKSSGTMAAAGYFPSTEESNQRRMAQSQQTQAAAAIPVSAPVQTTIAPAQPQQPAALMQQYNPMLHHPSFVPSQAGIYYHQQPTSYMPYMPAGMIPQGWPSHTAPMDPGIIMQNNGLQPQNIRTPIHRPYMPPGGSQPRFNRPPRQNRQNIVERSASERPSERSPVVSVTTGPSRSSPRSADGSTGNSIVQPSTFHSHMTRRREEATPVLNQNQTVSTQHQFVTPLATQQQQQQQQPQQHAVTTATTVLNPTAMEQNSAAVPALQHFQVQSQQQQHQQSMMVQAAMTPTATVPPPVAPQATSNPPPQIPHHVHHQPPPPIPQQQHHQLPHQNQSQQVHHHHHHQQQQPHHPAQHSANQHHQTQPPPPHQHQQHHHQHQQHMMPPPHHPSQHHHQMPPPPPLPHNQHHQHQQAPGNRPERRGRRRQDVRNQRGGERNQSNRANFSSQAPAAADNFTMEANSFPPLPGAANSVANSEVSYESKMSDVVRGINRMPGTGNGGQRAPSTTPSPVATPAPTPISSSMTSSHQGVSTSVVEVRGGADDIDSIVDDDATSSSQEEIDDSASAESRSVRSEPQTVSSVLEPSAVPAQPRSQKASTPVASPAAVPSQRQSESRQGLAPAQTQTRGQQQQQQQQIQPAVIVGASGSAQEAPKLSYAQILAQKNREAANNSGESLSTGGSTPNPNSGTPNGPNSGQNSNNPVSSGGGRASNQAGGAFRDQQNYQGGQQQQGPRSAQRGASKDNSARSDGTPSRAPNGGGRRNSKENRGGKYDRRKNDNRQK